MEINWKTVAVFGGIGFFLSLLVGAVSGVSFGVVLLRGLVSAAVFGGIGLGLNVLIKKYLPGLTGGEAGEEEAFETETGGGVDIVIEEEAPRDVNNAAAALRADLDEDMEEDEASSFVEEVEESSSENMEPAGEESEEVQSKGPSDAAEILQEADEAEEAEDVEELEEAGEEDAGLAAAGGAGEVDDLPDIGEFSGSFSTGGDYSEEEGGESMQSSEYSSGANTPVEILGQEESPETVAKAVQTMLKKE